MCNSSAFLNFYYEDMDGLLNIQNIFRENGTDCDYFISGPPDMVKTFKGYLLSKKVDKGQIKTDEWE